MLQKNVFLHGGVKMPYTPFRGWQLSDFEILNEKITDHMGKNAKESQILTSKIILCIIVSRFRYPYSSSYYNEVHKRSHQLSTSEIIR